MNDKDTSRDALTFAMPFLQAIGPRNIETGMLMAVGCWNLFLLPPEQKAVEEAKILQYFDFAASWFPSSADGIQEIKTWMERLIHRRQEKYAQRRRLIITHAISMQGDMITLTTGTTAVPETTS